MLTISHIVTGRMAQRPWQRLRLWSVGLAAALLVVGALLASPERLAMSERLDPLWQAEALISLGQYREALALLEGLETEGLDSSEVRKILLQRAVCQKFLGRYGEALAGFQALERKFDLIEDYLVFWQGECFEALDRPDDAVSAYTRVLQMESPSLLKDSAVLRAADLRLAQGRAEDAAGLFRHLLGISGQEVRAMVGLVKALEAVGDSAEARKVRLQLVRGYPEAPQTAAALKQMAPLKGVQERFYGAVAYLENKKHRKAAGLFRKIIRDASDRSWRGRAQYELGQVYFKLRDYRTAERAFQKAHRTYGVPKALFDLGRCSVRLGRDVQAAERFEEFARLYPSYTGAAEALWNAAMANERRGGYRQARKIFLKLVARYPRSEFADKGRWRAGFALYKTRDYKEAARTFLRLSRNTSETYLRDQGFYWAGKCYLRSGQEEVGAFWTQRATEGFPTSYYSARARAVLGVTSDIFPAVSDVDPAAAGEAYRPSVYLLKGDVLAALGLYRLAEREYMRAGRVHKNNLFALGDLLQRYERIGSMFLALRVSNLMIDVERRQGIPMTLASFRRLYPTYYWGEISRTARELDLNPNLILAIIRQESAFNEDALSPAGARGLMQVMPTTGRRVARKIRLKGFSVDDLWQAQTSIRLGGRHLSDHLRYFDRSKDRQLGLALSAYNAGLKAARRWSRRLPKGDVDEFVESIPYRETRNYVKLVYRNYQVYSYLQGEDRVQDRAH